MFFFVPLLQNHSFDSIFKTADNLSSIRHHFLCYYDEFEGDVVACLAFYNVYLHRQATVLAEQIKK